MVQKKIEVVFVVLFAISCLSLFHQFGEVTSPRTAPGNRRTEVDDSAVARQNHTPGVSASSQSQQGKKPNSTDEEPKELASTAITSSTNDPPAPTNQNAGTDATTSKEPATPIEDQEVNIKVNYPVFVASLYKSGTTTIHAYFQCGGQKSVHYAAGRTRTGPCLQRRIQKGLHPVFEGCGGDTFDIYTDNANLNSPRSCFDPSVHGLDQIYESYPNGTILLAVRDSNRWLDSVERYKFPKWELLPHLQQCPDLWLTQKEEIGNRTLTKDDILHFYDWHTEHVRKFAAQHPSMTYIEVKLEDTNTAQILEEKVGIPASCWGHSNINKRHASTEEQKK